MTDAPKPGTTSDAAEVIAPQPSSVPGDSAVESTGPDAAETVTVSGDSESADESPVGDPAEPAVDGDADPAPEEQQVFVAQI